MREEELNFEESDYIICPFCGKEVLETEEINHYEMHEKESLSKKVKEELAKTGEANLALIKMATIAAEEELHQKHGYIIPKSKVDLSGATPEEIEKEWLTRDAMQRYVRVRKSLEEFDPTNWIVPPKAHFDPKDYTMGENIFGVEADSPEQVKAFATKYANKNWTKEEIEDLIRNPAKFLPKIETLAEKKEDFYMTLAEKLCDKFVGLWDSSKEKEGSRTLNEQITLMLGKEIFVRYRCPSCSFSLRGSKLPRAEKYRELIKHYDEVHLQKVKGRAALATVKRIDLGPDTSIEAEMRKVRATEFTATAPSTAKGQEVESGPLMKHQTGSPNPEQCHKNEKLDDIIKHPEGTALPSVADRRKPFEELTKRTDKGTKHLARVFSNLAPNPEELKEIKEDYKDFYYEMPKGQFVCEACFAKFKTFRKFWTHFQTEHQRMAKQPSKYRNYFKDRYSKK